MNINYIVSGIHNVEVDMGKGEIKVKGDFDPVKIQKRIEKLCKKKIELVSPKVQIKESTTTQKIVVKETKEVVLTLTHVLKVDLYIDLQITIYAADLICQFIALVENIKWTIIGSSWRLIYKNLFVCLVYWTNF